MNEAQWRINALRVAIRIQLPTPDLVDLALAAWRCDPARPAAPWLLARVLRQRGDPKLAWGFAVAATALPPSAADPDVSAWRAWVERGLAAAARGDRADAAASYDRALVAAPADAAAELRKLRAGLTPG